MEGELIEPRLNLRLAQDVGDRFAEAIERSV